MRQTRTTATSQRQKCARLKPQPLRKCRNAPDSSHSHFAKTEMRQTQATATSKRQKYARLEPQPLRKDRNAPDCQFTAALGEPGNATSDISSDDDSKAPMIQKKTIHMWGSPLRVISMIYFFMFFILGVRRHRGKHCTSPGSYAASSSPQRRDQVPACTSPRRGRRSRCFLAALAHLQYKNSFG